MTSAALATERQSQSESKEIVVFMIRRDTKCVECGRALFKGSFLRMEGDRPLCLDCANLGHLEFLASGNTALTRRATKHSPLRTVVVRWARARNRYERQGILVATEPLNAPRRSVSRTRKFAHANANEPQCAGRQKTESMRRG